DLQALSLALGWDPAVVQPQGVTPGAFVTDQGGVVLSPGPGRADAALLGIGREGMVGEGALAHVHFRVLEAGDPRFAIARAMGRDAHNRPLPAITPGCGGARRRPAATGPLPGSRKPPRGRSRPQWRA